MNSIKKKCQLCNENESKYKCPKCLILYCSLNCYKLHKDACAAKNAVDSELPAVVGVNQTDHQSSTQSAKAVNVSGPSLSSSSSLDSSTVPMLKMSITTTSGEPQKQQPETSVSSQTNNENEEADDVKNVQSDFVPAAKLKLLGESDEVRALLANPHLRSLLTGLNEHNTDIDVRIDKAMHEPLFQEFSDACLKVVQKQSDLQPIL